MHPPIVKIRRFDLTVGTPEWEALRKEIKTRGIHPLGAIGESSELPEDGATFTVKTNPTGLHSNQFATEEGPRVFDCRILADFTPYGRRTKRRSGYILEDDSGFAALQELRRKYLVCGYCGKRHDANAFEVTGPQFCDACSGSEYLKPSDLHLLELRPLAEYMPKREATAPEWLVTEYARAQRDAAIAKARRRKKERLDSLERKRANLALESNLIELLTDNGLAWRHIENLIFYDHTQEFVFGWRNPLTDKEREEIRTVLNSIPTIGAFNIKLKGGE